MGVLRADLIGVWERVSPHIADLLCGAEAGGEAESLEKGVGDVGVARVAAYLLHKAIVRGGLLREVGVQDKWGEGRRGLPAVANAGGKGRVALSL